MTSYHLVQMKEELKNKFPAWTQEINEKDKLILTDDLDSLFSVAILKKLFGCKIGAFYDFDTIYYNESIKNMIGVDCALEMEIRTFCNHVTRLQATDKVNTLSANVNNFYNCINVQQRDNYFSKYAGSTTLMILSLYDCWDILNDGESNNFTHQQLKVLVSIDSYFISAYNPARYRAYDAFKGWQKALNLQQFQPIFDKYTKAELSQFQREKGLKGNISTTYQNGKYRLNTTLDLEYLSELFPSLDFSLDVEFDKCYKLATKQLQINSNTSKHDISDRVFSLSVTRTNVCKYSYIPEN